MKNYQPQIKDLLKQFEEPWLNLNKVKDKMFKQFFEIFEMHNLHEIDSNYIRSKKLTFCKFI